MAPYFQPLIDLIATHPPPNGSLDRVLELCQAVEAEHGERIPHATLRVVEDVNPRMSPAVLIPEEMWHETFARMLLMGEGADLERLMDWYERPIAFVSTRRALTTLNWQGMFDFMPNPPANLPEKDLNRQLARILTALKFVLPAHRAAVAEEGPRRKPSYSPGDLAAGTFGTEPSGPPPRSVVLGDGIARLVVAWMAIHQQSLDSAAQQMGSRTADRGTQLLALNERWIKALSETFARRAADQSAGVSQIEIALGRIRYGRSPNHAYLDAFLPYEARQFGFTPYDRNPQDEPEGKRTWLVDLFRYRNRQLEFFLDEYGEYFPPAVPPKTRVAVAEEQRRKALYSERRKVIDTVEKRGAPLHVESEDDLFKFGCAFHEALMAARAASPSPADRSEAWKTLLAYLVRYLTTQTTHTEFNLDESPSYFDRLFPRAINGGAWHDCGVYAVRLAFVFLSLADCLKSAVYPAPPRVSFIMFPLHVGLIVELDGFPPIVAHNEILVSLAPDRFTASAKSAERPPPTVRDEWDDGAESSDPPDQSRLNEKFLEDVAAQLFLRDVDLPILRVPVAPVSAPPRKAQIWKAYEQLVVKRIGHLFSAVIEDPGRDEYQFDTRFLGVLTLEKRWRDERVVPFWNDGCFPLWLKSKDGLRQHPDRKDAFVHALEALLTPVEESYERDVRPKRTSSQRNSAPSLNCWARGHSG